MKRFLTALAFVVAIVTLDTSCRSDVITQFKTDTLIVQRPGRTDTIVVTRPDTIVVTKPETTLVYLPGTKDTIIDVRYTPPETTYVQRVDTVIKFHYDTTVVIKPETLIVFVHDTVVKHDTVVHYDTVRLDHSPAHICLQLPKADTLFFLSAADTMCNGAHMTSYYPGYNVYVDAPNATITMQLAAPSATRIPRTARILPGWMSTH